MSYESKFLIANLYECDWQKSGLLSADVIAEIKMSNIGHFFEQYFTEPASCTLLVNGRELTEDYYGKPFHKCTDLQGFIAALKAEENKDHYRRYSLLIAMLENINFDEWNNLAIIHFGY